MILFFLLSLLGDDNTLYLMDRSFSLIPIEEEFRYIHSKNGIQTVLGSRDSENLNEIYRAKIWLPIFSKIVFEYNLHKETDYDMKTEEHLFKLRWIPEEDAKIPLSFSLFLSPGSSHNKKYMGMGVGYWESTKNNHFLNLVIHEFDHNRLISHTESPDPEDPYTRLPIDLELQGCVNSNQADLCYKYYKTITAKKDFLENDEQTGRGEFGGMGLKNTIYYYIFPKISPGLILNYSKLDSSYISMPEDTINYKAKVDNLFAEPFLKTKISKRSTIQIGFPMNWRYIKNDSLEYKRKWLGLSLIYNHSLSNFIDLNLGLQKSWRNLNGEKNSETRGVVGFDLRFNQKSYIAFRQGIELDFPLPDNLKDYNNHTYFMFNHCF